MFFDASATTGVCLPVLYRPECDDSSRRRVDTDCIGYILFEDAFEVEKFNSLHLQVMVKMTTLLPKIIKISSKKTMIVEKESTVKQPLFDHVDYFQESFYQNTVKYDQQPLHQNTSFMFKNQLKLWKSL